MTSFSNPPIFGPSMNSLKEIKYLYRNELRGRYPELEITKLTDMVLEEVLNLSRVRLRIEDDREISDEKIFVLKSVLEGLKEEKPVQYLLGKAWFYDMELKVNPSVLIPRPETEELVHWIIDEQDGLPEGVIDLGTGSGCIAIALAKEFPNSRVYGVDVEVKALNLAQENAKSHGVDIDFFLFDILKEESLGFQQYEIMVSNPPYVTEEDGRYMQKNVLENEPHKALFAPGVDPFIFYRRIVDLADGHLRAGGRLYFEINERFGAEIRSLLLDRGYRNVVLRKDLNGKDRMIKARKE